MKNRSVNYPNVVFQVVGILLVLALLALIVIWITQSIFSFPVKLLLALWLLIFPVLLFFMRKLLVAKNIKQKYLYKVVLLGVLFFYLLPIAVTIGLVRNQHVYIRDAYVIIQQLDEYYRENSKFPDSLEVLASEKGSVVPPSFGSMKMLHYYTSDNNSYTMEMYTPYNRFGRFIEYSPHTCIWGYRP